MSRHRACESDAAGQCLYVFGVVDASAVPDDLPPACDVVSGPLRALSLERVAVVYCAIDPEVLSDLDVDSSESGSLARLARCHDGVVRELAEHGPVLPVRLGTLCPDIDCLMRLLRRGADDLGAQLDSVRNRSEWALRVRAPHRRDGAPPQRAASGTSYLMAKVAAVDAAVERESSLSVSMRDADRALARLAEETGGPEPYAAGAAISRTYLVADDRRSAFHATARAAVAELRALGCEAEVAGPLPPYSFVDLRLEVSA